MGEPEQKRKKGTEENRGETKGKEKKGYSFVWIFSMSFLGIFLAFLGVIYEFNIDRFIAVIGIIAALLIGVITLYFNKENKERWKYYIEYGCIFVVSLSVSLLVIPQIYEGSEQPMDAPGEVEITAENIPDNENREEKYEDMLLGKEDEKFEPKEFVYIEDLYFSDLIYYCDGREIKEEDRPDAIKNVMQDTFINGNLPDRYEDDPEKLNKGAYAENTEKANEYFNAYKEIENCGIEEGDKLLFISKARNYRKEADNEFITVENSKNLIWDCDAEKTQLSICMNHETDEEQIKEWKEEAKACNQDIIYACWNIIQIQRHLGMPIDEKVREEWIKAYKWEKNNTPENGADYDAIIWAIENI